MSTLTDTPLGADSLALLQTFKDFQASNANVFGSPWSLHWFWCQHKERLIESGAVTKLAGRRFINPPIFTRETLEIGKAEAARSRR